MHVATRMTSLGAHAPLTQVPAWDKLMSRVRKLHDDRSVPNKRDRFLLDDSILTRMPSSPCRYIKGIRDFMQTWMRYADYRDSFIDRLQQDPELAEVRLRIGKLHEDGRIHLSLATRKGFVSVSFTQDQYEF